MQVLPRHAEREAGVEVTLRLLPAEPPVGARLRVCSRWDPRTCPAAVGNRLACRAEHRSPSVRGRRGADPWELASLPHAEPRGRIPEHSLIRSAASLRRRSVPRGPASETLCREPPAGPAGPPMARRFLLVTSRDQPPTPNRQACVCTTVFIHIVSTIHPGSRSFTPEVSRGSTRWLGN